MIGSSVKWKGQWNGLLGKWTDSNDYPVSPGRIPGLQLWYSAQHSAYNAFTYEQALPTLFDASGNGWDAAQATGSAQARFLTHDGRNYLRCPGIAGNYASTPDSAAVSITGDIDLRAWVALNDWSPAAAATLLGRWIPTGNNRSYRLLVNANGTLSIFYTTNGSSIGSAQSSVAVPDVALALLWVRATLSVGSPNGVATFYTSSDGITWTQLGTTVAATGATAIFDGTAPLEVGATVGGAAENVAGRVYRAQVYSGINGTLVADFDPSRGNFNSATIGSATGETWTINRTGLDPAMIVSARAFMPLTDDFYDIAAGAAGVLQNVGGGTMFSVRGCSSVAGSMQAIGFSTDTDTNARMRMGTATTSFEVAGRRLDADSSVANAATTQQVAYEFAVQAGRLNYTGALSANFKNGVLVGSESAFQTAGSTSNTASARMRVFSDLANTPAAFQSGPVTDLLLYNQAVTSANILGLSTFLKSQAGV